MTHSKAELGTLKRGSFILCALLISLTFSCTKLSRPAEKKGSFDHQKSDLHLEVKKYQLENGLRLLVYENHKLPIFSYHTFFDVGGRHEGAGTTGATHFLEHMMFKGAKKYGPGTFFKLIESNGGNSNAYTNFDSTVYYESLPTKNAGKDMVETIIDMEADRMQYLALESAAFEKERGVILEERKNRYENSPRGQLYLEMMQSIFEGTPYGGSVIGDKQDLHNLSRDQVMGYFKKFYTPDNAIVIVAGDVEGDKVYQLIKEKFGKIAPSTSEVRDFRASRDNPELFKHKGSYKKHIKIHNKQAVSPMFMLAFPGNAIGTKEGFVRDILSSILGQGESSYLHERFVVGRRPLFTGLYAANYTLKYNGVFYIAGEVAKGKSLKGATDHLISDTKKLCDTAITSRSLQKTKNQYLVGYISEIETNDGVAQFLGLRENFFGDYSYYKKELEIYKGITLDEVKQSCRELFRDGNYVLVSIWKSHPAS